MASPGPPPNQGDLAGVRFEAYPLAPVGTFLGIACITTGLRIYWRIRPTWRIGADDYTLVFALVLTIVWYGIDVAMYYYGRGIEGFIPDPWTMGPLIVADGVLWVWGLNVIRISAALLLLRLKDSLRWKLALWTVITVQACMLIVGTTMHLVMCQPISARWAPTPTAKCIPVPDFMIYGYVYSGLTIASDFTISILPITFIRTLRRPFYEKFLIGCLMTAGMGATGIAIARLLLIMGYLGKGAARINALQDFLWGMELTIGVLATSLPTLKAPVHNLLQSWGVLRSTSSSDMSPDSFLDEMTNGTHVENQMRQWGSLVRGLPPQAPDEGESGSSLEKNASVQRGGLGSAGCTVQGTSLVLFTERHEFPGPLLSTRANLFALVSVLYEITKGQPPYQGLKDTKIRARCLRVHDFPEATSFGALGALTEKCWRSK
ncbi:hypothetical protein B0I37DRAFT_328984 [Chaetomium sp. MPI-CAGE-AT-0009]|nr:hypothetical protein B0I37DRAFT_328984 [Chaetomium sp. MPI-CAGE-AT-0009]